MFAICIELRRSSPAQINRVTFVTAGNGGNYEGLETQWFPQPETTAFRSGQSRRAKYFRGLS